MAAVGAADGEAGVLAGRGQREVPAAVACRPGSPRSAQMALPQAATAEEMAPLSQKSPSDLAGSSEFCLPDR